MTIKEAILQSLDELNSVTNYLEVYNHIVSKKYYDFKDAKTPASTVSALLGDFIRKGDSRVKRITGEGGTFSYYLTKNDQNISLDTLVPTVLPESRKVDRFNNYEERALHKLLSTYLKSKKTYSKTIFHEQSQNSKDNHQKWVHPDMVGIDFLKLRTTAGSALLKAVDRKNTFTLTSYEIKKEINSDYELKKTFFQAVSNSSWANYGYLVAFEISDSLEEEMRRLNESFGIGIIELNANAFQSRELFAAKYKSLDFTTIDKLCNINRDFEKFMEQTEKILTAEDRYITATERELGDFCDEYFSNDTDVLAYCKAKNIPIEEDVLDIVMLQ
jgi:hypothetical protein